MPMIDLTMPRGAIPQKRLTKLMDELSTSLIAWEGAPDNEKTRSVTWAFVHPVAPRGVYVGGRSQGKPYYRVELTVPDKTLLHDNDERKAGLIRLVTEHVLRAEGSPVDEENSARVWCLIYEVLDGNWGAFSDQFTMRKIMGYIGARPVPKEKLAEIPLPT